MLAWQLVNNPSLLCLSPTLLSYYHILSIEFPLTFSWKTADYLSNPHPLEYLLWSRTVPSVYYPQSLLGLSYLGHSSSQSHSSFAQVMDFPA